MKEIFDWRGLPVFLTIVIMIVGIIVYIVNLNAQVSVIEKDHMVFGAVYQRQVDDIKTSQLRVEEKLDRFIEKF